MRLDKDEMRIRREKIIEVAFQMFCEQGIEQVSMGQIAKQSGVGKRTMYRYFNNKMCLIIDVLVHQWGLLMDGIKKNIGFYTTYPSLTGYEQIALWLDAFRQIYENNTHLILFSYEAKLNVMRNKTCFTQEQKNFFTYGICEPWVAALERGKSDGTLSFSHNSIEVFYAMWASIRGCIALCGESSPCKNTYQVMEETILKALRAK